MLQTEIAVVGAGPAGLAAALQASEAGARVTLLDEYPRPGGQFFKQAPAAFKLLDRSLLGRGYDQGQELMRRIEEGKVELLTDTLVWGALEPGALEIYRKGECQRLEAQRIVVATGGYDRPMAFPGWTLPGVITAGAAQTLVKSQWVLPGSRVLMVGTGPFQLPVAAQLVKAGATLVGLLEASRANEWMKGLPALWRHLDKLREAQEYGMALLKARVPLKFGWTILEARGSQRVEQAVITRVDQNGKPIPGTEKTLEVDTICLAFGFLPSLQLPRLLGCSSRWDRETESWVTDHDRDQRSSVPEVFVAGETTGIGGRDVALGEGAIAGFQAAADLGHTRTGGAQEMSRVRRELERHREFATYLNRTFAPKPGLYTLMRDDTIICRCEEVTAGAIAAAARRWGGNLRTIKQWTRAGMGPCQGRICGALVARIAATESGTRLEEIGPDTPRPPLKPIPLAAMAEMPR